MRVSFLVFFTLFSLFTSVLWSVPSPAEALSVIPCGRNEDDSSTPENEKDKCTLCHIVVGVNNIVIIIRNLMSAFAVVVVVAMAIVYITSGGDAGQMELAKKGITAALIGFAIVLLAWLAVNFVFTLPLFNNNGLVKADWQKLKCDTASLAK